MSIKNELITLKRTREDLEKQLSDISKILDNLIKQRNGLVQETETLSTRTSNLAKTLLKKVQEELKSINQQIIQEERRKANVEKEIEETNKNISQREKDTTLYIAEQSSIMIPKFLEYIEKNLEEIGREIRKTYSIREVTNSEGRTTRDIGIYDEKKNVFIVTSEDFYFTKYIDGKLTDVYTEWYEDYRKSFISHLLETLKNNYHYYKYDAFFKLTIEDSCFTLELV